MLWQENRTYDAVVKLDMYQNLQRHRAVLSAIAQLLYCERNKRNVPGKLNTDRRTSLRTLGIIVVDHITATDHANNSISFSSNHTFALIHSSVLFMFTVYSYISIYINIYSLPMILITE